VFLRKLASTAALLCSWQVLAQAAVQPISSAPVGGVTLTIKGDSDTIVAVPLAASTEFTGKVSGVISGPAGFFSIKVAVVTNWTTDGFADFWYVRFTSGARRGMYYTIAANTTSQLKLETAGDDLSGVVVGDAFQVVRHWTLGTLFPPANSVPPVDPDEARTNPLAASTDLTSAGRKSEILLPDTETAGINLPVASRYFFTMANGWVADKTGYPASDNVILPPDSYLIVRQPASVAADVTWMFLGQVVTSAVTVPLATQASMKQDNYIGLIRPVAIRLADAGLETGFVDSVGLAGFQRRDTLLVFDNSVASHQKSASKSYFRRGGIWFSDATGHPVADNELLQPGSGFVIRKHLRPGASTAWWTNTVAY
jgi:uncharacterized protein (TIGR02597 family)